MKWLVQRKQKVEEWGFFVLARAWMTMNHVGRSVDDSLASTSRAHTNGRLRTSADEHRPTHHQLIARCTMLGRYNIEVA